MQPFLKWPGGKRWLVSRFLEYVPQNYNRYIEPFLGGGAMFFALESENALISDINADLINVYTIMRNQPEALAERLVAHSNFHCNQYYYTIRAQVPADPLEKAARFLYLNRTCYNGMYRVNAQGQFNVPIGTKTNCLYDIDQFVGYSHVLTNAEILVNDFEVSIQQAVDGDLVFADPPYATGNADACFLKYNGTLFTWDDQIRLHGAIVAAAERGAQIILTNTNNIEISDMYLRSGFFVSRISRSSNIAGRVVGRRSVEELLITSFQHDLN